MTVMLCCKEKARTRHTWMRRLINSISCSELNRMVGDKGWFYIFLFCYTFGVGLVLHTIGKEWDHGFGVMRDAVAAGVFFIGTSIIALYNGKHKHKKKAVRSWGTLMLYYTMLIMPAVTYGDVPLEHFVYLLFVYIGVHILISVFTEMKDKAADLPTKPEREVYDKENRIATPKIQVYIFMFFFGVVLCVFLQWLGREKFQKLRQFKLIISTITFFANKEIALYYNTKNTYRYNKVRNSFMLFCVFSTSQLLAITYPEFSTTTFMFLAISLNILIFVHMAIIELPDKVPDHDKAIDANTISELIIEA